jgi:hypothetical protein
MARMEGDLMWRKLHLATMLHHLELDRDELASLL